MLGDTNMIDDARFGREGDDGCIMAPPKAIDDRDIDQLLAALTDQQLAELFSMALHDVAMLRRRRRRERQRAQAEAPALDHPSKDRC